MANSLFNGKQRITALFAIVIYRHHKYGHAIDSSFWGLSYLFTIGIPIGISASKHDGIHSQYWTETRANRRAAKYFGKYYGVNWDFTKYPLN
jgi:hypothetical protein